MRKDVKEFLLDMALVVCCLYVVAQAVRALLLFI
jgi:hypothetical protein